MSRLLSRVALEREDFPYLLRAPLPELDVHRRQMQKAVLDAHARWNRPPYTYNFEVQGESFDLLYDLFERICSQTFVAITDQTKNRRAAWAYVQTATDAAPIWHDHLTTASLNGAYYLSVPDPSGQLVLRHLDRELRVTPKVGHLYVFPRWLAHRPNPQKSANPRITINVELITTRYPVTRNRGVRW